MKHTTMTTENHTLNNQTFARNATTVTPTESGTSTNETLVRTTPSVPRGSNDPMPPDCEEAGGKGGREFKDYGDS